LISSTELELDLGSQLKGYRRVQDEHRKKAKRAERAIRSVVRQLNELHVERISSEIAERYGSHLGTVVAAFLRPRLLGVTPKLLSNGQDEAE
jgi:hypothetical protein